MIVDTSAIMSVILGEADAEVYLHHMQNAPTLRIAAPTLVEAGIVASRRAGQEAASDVEALLADLEAEVVPFNEEQARLARAGWERFGKGHHPAALNLGDTYSYALSKATGEPLLFKGQDFPQTDVESAL